MSGSELDDLVDDKDELAKAARESFDEESEKQEYDDDTDIAEDAEEPPDA